MSSSLEDLVQLFSKLPGLGPRSARRAVFYILKNNEKLIPRLSNSLLSLKEELKDCTRCGNIDIINPCNICNNYNKLQKKDK